MLLDETTTTTLPDFEMPDLSWLEGLQELLGGLGGILDLVQGFSDGLMGLLGWAASNMWLFVLAMVLTICGSWLVTAFFMWCGFILLKKRENFGKLFVTTIENFLFGLILGLIPVLGIILVVIVQIININRRHDVGGWSATLIWCFGYLATFALICVIFILSGGIVIIQEFLGGLFVL